MADRSRWLALAAALAGVTAAMASALFAGPGAGAVTKGAVALANDAPISREDYARALSVIEADKRSPLTEEDRARALQRLIEEELLVRRGIALDLAASDPSVRRALAQAMAQFAAAQAARAAAPDDATLQTFLSERPQLLARQSDQRIRFVVLPAAASDKIAAMVTSLRSGMDFAAAAKAAGAVDGGAPDGFLAPADLAARAGPSVRDAVAALAPGQAAGPIPLGAQVGFVQLVARRDPPARDFAAVRATVAEAWRQEQESQALETYLAQLKRDARIVYAPDAPRPGQ
ncbi:MAG: peptidylprolyl isomerase [Caulobacterales bacterium]|jgi:parvulin-like peptidyl-prolyl isomerase